MGMPMMEVSEEEVPWILPKPALITVAMFTKRHFQGELQSKACSILWSKKAALK